MTSITNEPLWAPSAERVSGTRMAEFAARFAAAGGESTGTDTYAQLHAISVERPDDFWAEVWSYCGAIGERGERITARMPSPDFAPGDPRETRFFPDARINLAENYLRRSDDAPALIYRGEDVVQRTVSFAELRILVARTQRALLAAGVVAGDRVATFVPNSPDAVIVFLAAAGIGAVFSSTSPDFGTDGVLDRFGQIEPKVLVATDGYYYGGVRHDCMDKVAAVAAGLPSLRQVVIAPYGDGNSASTVLASTVLASNVSAIPGAVTMADWLAPHGETEPIFERASFDQPIYILYSSGTTGKPKCIVHRAGGVLMKHWVEQQLHCDLRQGDRLMYFTTTGWMMWNWLVAGLASGVTLVLYDGSPFHPTPSRLFDIADETGPRVFGVSAKFVEAVMKEGLRPIETHALDTVDVICSTGSPLAPEGFEYVHEAVKANVHLASFSGGTDICGCFVIGDPTSPVWAGEIQAPALGMDIAVLDDSGAAMGPDEQGELVCRNAFPSMPLEFWDDPGAARYTAAYFERFPGMWHHGDFAEWTAHGGMVITGRSDATLNPGGVRIGTAEIYRQVDQIDEVLEGVVIGQQRQADTRVVLFVRLRDGITLDDELRGRIRRQIRTGASPRHVPAVIAQVPVIPRTRSGKLVELAVREVVHGHAINNAEAIDDPAALEHFRDHPDLR
ncbi:MAG: acetoacetyl-CoA synthetase [Candidatus Poriferisodalaceae bacterium]|jgi:acetoacetyl-CoA synthetase